MNDMGRRSFGRGRGRGRVVQNSGVDVPVIPKGRGIPIAKGTNKNIPVPLPPRGRGRPKKIPVNPTTVDDFIQATSSNLPTINFLNVAEYFKMLRAPELRQAKDVV